mgnify:CR=1 FL=1
MDGRSARTRKNTVVVVILACAIQYTLLRRMRNRQYRREPPAGTGPKQRKSGK